MHQLTIFIFLVLLTVMIHEGGHLVVARWCGWHIKGVVLKPWGVGVKLSLGTGHVEDVWKLALGGPVASALLALAFLPFTTSNIYAFCGFVLNAMAVLVNLCPVGPADGAYILRSLRGVPPPAA